MKREERNEKMSGFYHEMLKRDVENIKVYVDGLSTCVNYGRKGDILDEIKSIKKYLALMEKAIKDAPNNQQKVYHLSH